MESSSRNDQIQGLRRPHPNLMKYYIVKSFYWGPLIIVGLLYHIFRYRTLHYRFDEEGVGMGWGVLFRREIHLTYSRIQDIHLTSNIVERYLGLARVHIQTASGRAGAEMVIEGLLDFEAVRDHLYSRMRGLNEPDNTGGRWRWRCGSCHAGDRSRAQGDPPAARAAPAAADRGRS
jgi:putative membrane protein